MLSFQHYLTCVDVYAAGEALGIVTGGFPAPAAVTMLDKLRKAQQHRDRLRQLLMRKPRGK